MPCPNKNLSSWNNLVNTLGSETAALTVFNINDFEIPSLQDGIDMWNIFKSGKAKVSDEIREMVKQLKLTRAKEQVATMERIISSSPQDGRQRVLSLLKKNLEDYIQVIENDEATVSVSNLMAGGEIEDGEKYKNYAEFGTFIHHVIETLQKEIIGSSNSIVRIFSKEKLKDIYEAYDKKFIIKNLIENGEITNMDELYNMTNDILTTVQSYISRGHTVLPEISIMSKDRWGRNIVGRLDILTIDQKGVVNIIDTKTKKINANVFTDPLTKQYPINASPYTDSKFMETGGRNSYDNWDLQLAIYQRMLNNLGVQTNEKIIIQLLYAGDYMNQDKYKQFDEVGNDTFEYSYYKQGIYVSDEDMKVTDTEVLRYRKFVNLVKEVFPSGESTKESEPLGNKSKYIFDLNEEDAAALVEKLKLTTEDEIKKANAQIKEIKQKSGDKSLLKYYEDRVQALQKILDSFNQNAESGIKLGVVLKSLQVDMQNLSNTAIKIREENITDDDFLSKTAELNQLNKVSVAFDDFISSLKNHLLDGGMNKNDKAFEIINDIQNNIGTVRSIFLRAGFKHQLRALKDVITPKQQERMTEQRKQIFTAQIKKLKEKRDAIASGEKSTGYWYRLINAKIFTPDVTPKTEIEKIDFEILKLESKLDGIDFTDKGLENYLNASLDPNSMLFVGQETGWTTSVISSASSADPVIASHVNMLKKAMFQGGKDHVNFIESEGIQQEFDKFRQGETDVIALNERISEVRTETQFDEDGTETQVQTRGYANPLSSKYYSIYESHYNNLRQLNKKIRETNDPDELKALKRQKADAIQTHLVWRLENTQMKFVREIYELDKLLPAEYKARRDELYEEKGLLEQSAGFNNMERLDEDTAYRIAEIEVELEKLRMEYANREQGGYQKYIDLMDKYYSYDINQNYYDRLLNQKIAEYTDQNNNVNWDAVNKWKQENTIKRPKQEWYDAVSDIWDDIFMIIGRSNPQIERLQERYREILSQYRRKGVVDSRFLSEEDIETLEQIESTIEMYKLAGGKSKLDYNDRNKLNDLFQELAVMQTKVENPFYLKEFNVRLQALDQKWNLYQQEKDENAKEKSLDQFVLEEQEFKTWYDKNHTNSYTSRLASNEGLNPLPKKFNMLTVPVDEAMFEVKPDFKFTIKRLKDEAINPEYQEDANGYPMPLGLTREGAKVEGNSPWLNPKYEQIRNNPRDAEFYNSFVGRFLAMQDETTGYNLGYNFPGYEQQSIDDYKEKGLLGGFKNRLKLFRDKNLVVGSTYDYSLNNYRSNIDDRVQLKHNTPLPLNQQTRDGIGAVLRWYENAHMNVALAEVESVSKAMIAFQESKLDQLIKGANFPEKQKRIDGQTIVINQMKFEHDKLVRGEWKKDEGLIGRYADLILRGIGFTRLAFDLTNQVGNLLSGNVQAYLGSHSSALYSGKNYVWAKGKIYAFQGGLIGSLIADQGKFGGRSFMTNMFLYWNPQQKQLEKYYNRTRTTSQRLAQGVVDLNADFYVMDKGEFEIASTIWLSIMNATKVKLVATRDENGKPLEYLKDADGNIQTVNAFDAYTQDNKGRIIIREDVDWSKQDEDALQRTVWSEIERTQGNYADADKTSMEAGFKGRLLFYYRKYLAPSIRNRIGRVENQWSAGAISYGYWRALLKSMKVNGPINTMAAIFGRSEEKTGVSDYYKMKSQMAAREFATVALLYVIGLAIKGAIPPDKEDDKTYGMARVPLLNLINIYAKVQRETSSLTPIPIMGGLRAYIESFGEFTNANRDVGRIIRLLEHGIFLMGAQISDNKYWQKNAYYQKKYGPFQKGDTKIKKDLMDLTGYMNLFDIFNPGMRARIWKSTL